MSKDDGGNAFPVADYDHMALQSLTVDEHKRQLLGMSLRDYFAAKAMQAFAGAEYDSRLEFEHWAKHAYMMADAMLAARVKS